MLVPPPPSTPSPPPRPRSAQADRQSRSSITSAFHVQLSRPVMPSPPPSACSGQQRRRRRRTRRRLAEGAYRRRRPRVIIFRHFALIAIPPRRRFECTCAPSTPTIVYHILLYCNTKRRSRDILFCSPVYTFCYYYMYIIITHSRRRLIKRNFIYLLLYYFVFLFFTPAAYLSLSLSLVYLLIIAKIYDFVAAAAASDHTVRRAPWNSFHTQRPRRRTRNNVSHVVPAMIIIINRVWVRTLFSLVTRNDNHWTHLGALSIEIRCRVKNIPYIYYIYY